MDKMTTDEKRACRREWVNFCLQTNYRLGIVTRLNLVKEFIRQQERRNYGKELRVYRKA